MATINVLTLIDGSAIAAAVSDGSLPSGSPEAPTSLGSLSYANVYVSMITLNSYVNGGSGQSKLTITANPGDAIEFAITTFSYNTDQTAYLYVGSFSPADVIAPLSYECFQEYIYLSTANPPLSSPTKFANQVSIASSLILRNNITVQFSLSAVLVNNTTGQTVGYFSWDPFIAVNG